MQKSEKIILTIFVAILFFVLVYAFLFINIHHHSCIILFLSLISTLLLFLIFEKQYNSINKITKILLLFTVIFFNSIFIESWQLFMPYPTIVVTKDYDKAVAIQKFIEKKYLTFAEINDYRDKQFLYLHTYSHKKFDKIAIAIANSDLYDESVTIGAYMVGSDDMYKSNENLEKCFNNRIKLIKGVKSVNTSVIYHEVKGKIEPDLTTIKIVVHIDNTLNDKNSVYKTINNFLPMPKDKKEIIVIED